MKNSKRFKRLQDNAKPYQHKTSKYAAKQAQKNPMSWDRYGELTANVDLANRLQGWGD